MSGWLDVEAMRREQLARIGEGILTFLSEVSKEVGASRNIVLQRTGNPAAPYMIRLGGTDSKRMFWESVVCHGEDVTDALGQAVHVYVLMGGK